jgi:hypothetical protein
VDQRSQRIALETDRYLISGSLVLPREGYRSRLSDYLNSADLRFIAITDAELRPLDGGPSVQRPFVAVSRDHLRLAYPLED